MSKAKELKKTRMPIICPDCLGTRFWPAIRCKGSPPTIICPRCHGTGNIGYAERTQTEIEAAEHERRE